jgi:hypothetical protein
LTRIEDSIARLRFKIPDVEREAKIAHLPLHLKF